MRFGLILASAILSLPVCANAADLVGLWSDQVDVTRFVSGQLQINAHEASFKATIGGQTVPVTRVGNALSFSLPGNAGAFRGELIGDAISGFWIQPSSTAKPYRFATPLNLRATEAGVWRGEVVPLSAAVTLNLKIERRADGILVGWFRSPESGFGMGRTYEITVNGDNVSMRDRQRPDDQITARLLPSEHALQLKVVEYDAVFTLRPQDALETVSFGQAPSLAGYSYHQPPQENDGWRTASASTEGLDEAALEHLTQAIAEHPVLDSRSPAIQGVLIARHGKLVFERYFMGFDRHRPHDVRSAGKSFTTTLAGIATDRGNLSPDSRMTSVLGRRMSRADADRRKAAMRLGDLMSMSSGLDCDDSDEGAPAKESTVMAQAANVDWTQYIIDARMKNSPGGQIATYCSADMHLVAAMTADATGEWLPALFDRALARPLQFGRYYWNLTPAGDGYGAGGAYLLPRDFIKLGQLFLSGGTWGGQRVISQAWIDAATSPHTRYEGGTEGRFTGAPNDPTAVHRYGYGWHLLTAPTTVGPLAQYVATGNGGQVIAVIPDLDLVVAFTGGAYNNSNWRKVVEEVLPDLVLPAVIDKRPVSPADGRRVRALSLPEPRSPRSAHRGR